MPNDQKELLPIVVQKENVLVDARLLHQQLQCGTQFSNWIKRRIEDFGFEKNRDFYPNLDKSTGGRQSEEYFLTLDMAKELAMMERNEAGKQVRRYFIQKEKEIRGISYLTPDEELFKDMKPRSINGRRLYHYRQMLARSGYSKKQGGSRRARYPQHFVLMDNELYITEEFALHLHHQMQVIKNRFAIIAMAPVLPENFGESLQIAGGAQ